MLTTVQEKQVLQFVEEVFDLRLELAMKDLVFKTKDKASQYKSAQFWLKHYGKIVHSQLDPKPLFENAYPSILKLIAEKSNYYKMFKEMV